MLGSAFVWVIVDGALVWLAPPRLCFVPTPGRPRTGVDSEPTVDPMGPRRAKARGLAGDLLCRSVLRSLAVACKRGSDELACRSSV